MGHNPSYTQYVAAERCGEIRYRFSLRETRVRDSYNVEDIPQTKLLIPKRIPANVTQSRNLTHVGGATSHYPETKPLHLIFIPQPLHLIFMAHAQTMAYDACLVTSHPDRLRFLKRADGRAFLRLAEIRLFYTGTENK